MDNRKLLYKLPEYRVLDSKRRKLIGFHLLDAVAFSRAATMLNLNKTRESKRPDVVACLAAFTRALDPNGDAQKWETIRRVEIMWDRGPHGTGDEAFATVNLPFDGVFLTPDGKPVDAAGNPAPAPQPWPETIVPASVDWDCCGVKNHAGRFFCFHCREANPDTKANQARLWPPL